MKVEHVVVKQAVLQTKISRIGSSLGAKMQMDSSTISQTRHARFKTAMLHGARNRSALAGAELMQQIH